MSENKQVRKHETKKRRPLDRKFQHNIDADAQMADVCVPEARLTQAITFFSRKKGMLSISSQEQIEQVQQAIIETAIPSNPLANLRDPSKIIVEYIFGSTAFTFKDHKPHSRQIGLRDFLAESVHLSSSEYRVLLQQINERICRELDVMTKAQSQADDMPEEQRAAYLAESKQTLIRHINRQINRLHGQLKKTQFSQTLPIKGSLYFSCSMVGLLCMRILIPLLLSPFTQTLPEMGIPTITAKAAIIAVFLLLWMRRRGDEFFTEDNPPIRSMPNQECQQIEHIPLTLHRVQEAHSIQRHYLNHQYIDGTETIFGWFTTENQRLTWQIIKGLRMYNDELLNQLTPEQRRAVSNNPIPVEYICEGEEGESYFAYRERLAEVVGEDQAEQLTPVSARLGQ